MPMEDSKWLETFVYSLLLMRCSYGPHGVEIITATIWSLISNRQTVTDTLQETICNLVSPDSEIRPPATAFDGFWDDAIGASLSLVQFIEYIVVPHATNILIADDMNENDENADMVRQRSKEFGKRFNAEHETDDEATGGNEGSTQADIPMV